MLCGFESRQFHQIFKMKIRVKLPVRYPYGKPPLLAIEEVIDDLLLWCWERDIDATLYKWDIDRDTRDIYAVLTVEKDSVLVIMLSKGAEWHKVSK